MRGGLRVYDTHTHLGIARHSGRACDRDEMLRHMDRAGVDRSMLIPFPVVEDYRATHDLIGEALRMHPDRFTGAACLDPFVPAQIFRDELKRCREEFGFTAWKLQPQYQAINPLSARNDHLFEAAIANRLTLICHTGSGAPFALPSLWIAAARRFPELRIVLGHAGGSVYFLEAIVAALVCPNIYIELSSLMPHNILDVLAHIPPSRLMIGSDIPESLETEMSKVFTLDIAEEAKREILWSTARRVFDGVSE